MKRTLYLIISVFMLSLATLGAALAAESKEENNLQKEAAAIDTTAGTPQGEKVVAQRLSKEFSVTDAQVQGMRDKKLGYGEIAIVLSLSQKMSGGATDANIQKVMAMRQGPPTMGWGQIAKTLGTKLGPALSQVKHVNKETSSEMKHEAKGNKEHMEQHQERHDEMKGHEGMGGGQGMSPGKGK